MAQTTLALILLPSVQASRASSCLTKSALPSLVLLATTGMHRRSHVTHAIQDARLVWVQLKLTALHAQITLI